LARLDGRRDEIGALLNDIAAGEMALADAQVREALMRTVREYSYRPEA
jgi:hypothetical protein